MIEDLLAKDPADRPENARAVAIRLGLADHEILGLALGLAQAVYGESALEVDLALRDVVLRGTDGHGGRRPRCVAGGLGPGPA